MCWIFKEECLDCKYYQENKCVHPNYMYCKHCELWTPKWYKENKIDDSLIVTYDYCPPDVPTLIVARKDKYDMTILNIIKGDEALELYRKLIGDDNK